MKKEVQPGKSWFRCNVCNDLHFGITAPRICPTCGYDNAYVTVPLVEAEVVGGIIVDNIQIKENARPISKQELLDNFEVLTQDKEYRLNPDEKFLDAVLDGLLKNMEDTGLKFCPCRLLTDDLSSDIALLCPCNFTVHNTYVDEGRCWCGLFTKRDRQVVEID